MLHWSTLDNQIRMLHYNIYNLPQHLHNDDISREQFTCDLKTFSFARAYSSDAPLKTSV